MRRGQGQDLPEFFRLQGAGVEDGRLIGHRQAPGQDPGVGAVQDEAQAGDLLHRFHHEGHAVVAPGRQKAGVDVDEVGPGLLTAAGQFLERPGVEGVKRLGHRGVEDVEIVRGNDQGHACLLRSSARTCCNSASMADKVWVQILGPDGPPGVLAHERQVGPGDVVRPPKGGAQQLAGHQQVRYQVKRAPGPALGHQGQALLGLLHDPQGTGHRLFQGRGQRVGVALGSGPGELEIGLDILGLQPQERGGHEAHPGQEIAPGKSGISLRAPGVGAPVGPLSRAGPGPGRRCGPRRRRRRDQAGPGPGLSGKRNPCPSLGQSGRPVRRPRQISPVPAIVGRSRDRVNYSLEKKPTWPGYRYGRADRIVRRCPGFKGSTSSQRPKRPDNFGLLTFSD